MRQRLKRFLTAAMLLSLIAAPLLPAAGFPGRNARRAARIVPPAPPIASELSGRIDEPAAPSPSAETHSSPSTSPPDDHALAEILRIRDAHGSVLKGSLFEEPFAPEVEPPRTQHAKQVEPLPRANQPNAFQAALRQIATGETKPHAAPKTPTTQDVEPNNPRADAASSPDHSLIVSLRAASRALDTKANDFEDARRFADAERLRALAQQLRQAARSLENGGEPNRSP